MGSFKTSGGNRQTRGRRIHRGTLTVIGTSPAIHATGSVGISGSVRGHQLVFLDGASDLDQTAARFLPLGYTLSEAAAANYSVKYVCPAPGRWVRSIVRCKGAAGVTDITIYRAADGTAAPALHATHYETVRLDIAAANTSYGFDTSGSMHFQEGDVIAFKINPTSNPDETNYTHILELYTRSMSASGSFNS